MKEEGRFRIITAAAIMAAVYLLYILKAVTIPIIIAVILAYLLDPLIDRMERLKVGRGTAILFLTFITVSFLLLAALFLIPAMEGELRAIAKKLPLYVKNFKANAAPAIEDVLSRYVPGMTFSVADVTARMEDMMKNVPVGIWNRILGGMTSTLKGTFSFIISLIGLMIIPLYLYYILKDFDNMKEKALSLIPPRSRAPLVSRFCEIDEVLSAFIRGQMIVCLILAILYSIGLSIIGLDLAIIIGLISGIAFIIPYLGTILGLTLASATAYLQFHDMKSLMYVVLLYIGVQAVEGTVITPRIVGEKVGLHPLAVVIAVITGGEIFGFLGILLAVPAAAVLKIFTLSAIESYRKSSYFRNA